MNFTNCEFDEFFAVRAARACATLGDPYASSETQSLNGGHEENGGSACSVDGLYETICAPGDGSVFALFLEPPHTNALNGVGSRHAEPEDLSTRIIHSALHTFQPEPVLYHCELLVPPSADTAYNEPRVHHATYIGQQSGWQDNSKSVDFYLVQNACRWRAVPIFAQRAAARVRAECDRQLQTPYSLLRYVTSSNVRPLRALAGLLDDSRAAPAHCATLTTRVLQKSLGADVGLPHASAYYGPSTLYNALARDAAHKAGALGAIALPEVPPDVVLAIEALLRGSMTPETVNDVGDALCERAVHHLALRCANTYVGGDEVSQVLAERHLATALLRWTALRSN